MKVVTFETSDGKTRYYLADDNDVPVEPVLEYLRFGDNRGLARNTLKLHCIHLKHFYTFLGQKEISYEDVTVGSPGRVYCVAQISYLFGKGDSDDA